jgi:hypothetical protein
MALNKTSNLTITGNIEHLFRHQFAIWLWSKQGTLTEGEGSVRLTTKLR